ncbi:TrbI/VirB10 family protein [Loktanella sp. Alg231-35]|uniref:TrbI/VirB10 family protein n=1 Tax=Loktanella sp. Alg231-35 TaxID=1922220 RepID=UPI000D55DD8E|nr:TrbI/VirB10 family protein [Loktanella sp. Alg231-35]
MSEVDELRERLAVLEGSQPGGRDTQNRRPSLLFALLGCTAIIALGSFAYLSLQPKPEAALPTAQPEEFQTSGDGFGEIAPFVPPPTLTPEPEVVVVERDPEPNAELLAQLAELQRQISALQNAPEPVVDEDSAAADAIDALTEQIAALQESSQNAQDSFAQELAARDRELQQLRMDLELAQLQKQTPAPGPSQEDLLDAERLRLEREEEARRLAELERRRADEQAFQQARIDSPTIAFGGTSGGSDSALDERTFGDVTDFVLNGALPTTVTQAEVIANPANTVVQGTMIQAAMETAISSELPGQVRAVISEDVHSYDGSRILIPRGSKLIGRYRAGADIAQSRITVAWDRIILPNNQTVKISSFGGDELGRSGVTGFVDTRFGERFGSAALISLISALPGAAAAQVQDETSAEILEDVGDDFADSTEGVIDEYLSIGPVIYVDQGARITVMVDRDLEIF